MRKFKLENLVPEPSSAPCCMFGCFVVYVLLAVSVAVGVVAVVLHFVAKFW